MPESSWSCPRCTLVNASEDVSCIICDTARPVVTRSKSTKPVSRSDPSVRPTASRNTEPSSSTFTQNTTRHQDASSTDEDMPLSSLVKRRQLQNSRASSGRVASAAACTALNTAKSAKPTRTTTDTSAISLISDDDESIVVESSEDSFSDDFPRIVNRSTAARKASKHDVNDPTTATKSVKQSVDSSASSSKPARMNSAGTAETRSLQSVLKVSYMPPPPPPKVNKTAAKTSKNTTKSAEMSASTPVEAGFWLDTLAPVTAGELAVHPKKIDELRQWLSHSRTLSTLGANHGLCILMGPSGIGKSAAAEVLARELGFSLRSWEDTGPIGSHSTSIDSADVSSELADMLRSKAYDIDDGVARVDYVSVLEDFRRFVLQSRLFPSLEISGMPTPQPADRESRDTLLLLHDVPRSQSTDYVDQRDMWSKISEIFTDFLASSAFPAILIISSGLQPGDPPSKPALSTMLGSHVVNHPSTRVIPFNPIPPVKLTKTLQSIASRSRTAVPNGALTEIVETSGGDLRHAIVSLQFLSTAGLAMKSNHQAKRPKIRDIFADDGSKHGLDPPGASLACGRDDFLDSLHVLSKMLYAKRDVTGRLENGPDVLAAVAPYDAATLAMFLHENGPAFFTDIDEYLAFSDVLGVADCCSRPATNWSSHRGLGDQMHGAVVARSAAVCNVHPAPNSFRPIHKPAIYVVERIAKLNREWITLHDLGNTLSSIASMNKLQQPRAPTMVSAAERIQHVIPTIAILLKAQRMTWSTIQKAPASLPYPAWQCGLCLASAEFGSYTTAGADGIVGTKIGWSASKQLRSTQTAAGGTDGEVLEAVDEDNKVLETHGGLLGEWTALAAGHNVDIISLLGDRAPSRQPGRPFNDSKKPPRTAAPLIPPGDDITEF